MLKKILGFFLGSCRNCYEWIVLDFCKDEDCKYYKRYKAEKKEEMRNV